MKRLAALAALLIIVVAAIAVGTGLREGPEVAAGDTPVVAQGHTDLVARGAYLARAGNCGGCHTARGGAAYAGGRAIPTDFGVFHSPNLTPDAATGIGRWSEADFWRAMHEGRGRDGLLLYPSFPYPQYTLLSRADVDALFAYLRSLPAVRQANRAHDLRFPYSVRPLLVFWRALYFRPGSFRADPKHDEAWNRGAYLVDGLGHCEVCHAPRGALLGGPFIPADAKGGTALDWYAPSLASPREAGVQAWPEERTVAFLRSGVSEEANAVGPMAEVIYDSLQHLDARDLQAMARYLKAQPQRRPPDAGASPADPRSSARGSRLYTRHCAACHGNAGEGALPVAPALAGNRMVTLASSQDAVRITLFGGYPPGTAANPEPFGMPPYASGLNNSEIADLLTYVRAAWGNTAAPVYDYEVARQRGDPLW